MGQIVNLLYLLFTYIVQSDINSDNHGVCVLS